MSDDPKVRKRDIALGDDPVTAAEELIKFGGGVSPDGSQVALTFNGRAFEMTSLLFVRVVESINAMHAEVRARQGGSPPGTLH